MHHQMVVPVPLGRQPFLPRIPNWSCQTHPQPSPDHLERDQMVDCPLWGVRAAIQRAINCEGVGEVYRDHHENPAGFLSRLSEALQSRTSVNLDSLDGRAVLAMHFVSQSAPDIPRRLRRLPRGPHTHQADLLEPAFWLFSGQGEESGRAHAQALQMVAVAVLWAFGLGWPQGGELGPQSSVQPNQQE